MTGAPGMRTVFDRLASERLVAADWADRLAEARAGEGPATPWFVRAMVGFGAWLASLLLISFVVGISVIATGGGYLVIGLMLMAGACAFRYRLGGDFAKQLTLATSLAGQGLFAFGVIEIRSDFDVEVMLGALLVVNAVLLVAFPDKTHRFLSVLLIVGSFAGLLYAWRAQELVPLLGPALTALLIVLLEREPFFAGRGWLGALTAIRAGVLISAFGCLMLSTIYVLPDFIGDYQFYPRPWISTALLGAMLIYVLRPAAAMVFGSAAGLPAIVVYAVAAIVAAAAWPAPGLTLSLVVIVAASVHGHGVYRGGGIGFLVVFTAAYFYGIDVSMLVKSASLVTTGVIVLGCRWLFVRAVGPSEARADA